jgi:hypothetical protein
MKNNRKVKMIINEGIPLRSLKFRPNDLCTCGSGKKNKKCCQNDTQYRFPQREWEKKEAEKKKNQDTEKTFNLEKELLENG